METRVGLLKEKTILIVEDEPEILNMIQEALVLAGARVLTASSAEQALRLFESEKTDLIISDIRMPGQGGEFLLSRVRQQSSATPPIIMITGYADFSPESAFSMGADGFLFKPFGVKTVIESAAKALIPIEEKWVDRREGIASELEIVRSFDSLEAMLKSNQIQFGRGGFFIKLDGELPSVNEIAECRMEFSKDKEASLQFYAICRWVRPEALKKSQGKFLPRGAGFEYMQISQSSRPLWKSLSSQLTCAAYIPNSIL